MKRSSSSRFTSFPCFAVAEFDPNYVVLFTSHGVGLNLHDGRQYFNRNMLLYRPLGPAEQVVIQT